MRLSHLCQTLILPMVVFTALMSAVLQLLLLNPMLSDNSPASALTAAQLFWLTAILASRGLMVFCLTLAQHPYGRHLFNAFTVSIVLTITCSLILLQQKAPVLFNPEALNIIALAHYLNQHGLTDISPQNLTLALITILMSACELIFFVWTTLLYRLRSETEKKAGKAPV